MHSIYPAVSFDSTITYPSVAYPAPQYTTGTATQQADGQAFATLGALLHLPDWSSGSGRPGIIAMHGRNSSPVQAFGASYGSEFGDYLISLVNSGFVVLAIDNGHNSWSNNLGLRVMDQAYTYLTGITGGTKIGLLSTSMGTNLALQWHRRHPTLVGGSYMISAFADLDTVRATGGWTTPYTILPGDPNAGITYPTPGDATNVASLNGAYICSNDASWTANAILQGHTPSRYPEQWRGKRMVLQHATLDGGVPYQSAVWWVNAVNDPLCTLRLVTASTATHIPYTHLAGATTDAATLAAGGAARSELRDFFLGVL
jgi:hypothetical protein